MFVTWSIEPNGGLESAWITFGRDGMSARGRAVGTSPEPYWLTYELVTAGDNVTRRIAVSVDKGAGVSELDLARDETGTWTANGVELPDVAGALDCDLGLSPLTNTMPILRHGLHLGPGRRDLLIAWISVPDLAVRRSHQTYEHLRLTDRAAVVRYSSGSFTADIEVDRDGVVARYPRLGQRIR